MADSWQQIDSDGTLMSWSSTGLNLTDFWHPLETLNRATYERSFGTGYTSLERLTAIYSTIYNLHNSITVLIGAYVNHTDSDGDWDGAGGEIAPIWTEEDILDAIGDEDRVVVTEFSTDIGPWLLQSYKIVNMLKWKRATPRIVGEEKTGTHWDNPFVWTLAEALPLAKTAYNIANWIPQTARLSQYGASYEAPTMQRQCVVEFYTARGHYEVDNTSTLGKSAVVYATPCALWNIWGDRTYDSPDGWIENRKTKVDEAGESQDDTLIFPTTLMDSKSSDPGHPVETAIWPPDSPSSQINTCDLYSAVAVLKYDGSNGFKFKDW